jgi:predicted nucleic acid-binding protein
MACLETTFLIDLLRGKREVKELKDHLDKDTLAVAAPSLMELWSGACIAQQSAAEKEKILDLFQSLDVLTLDEKSAREAGEIEAELLRKGLPIETEDMMSAGIARMHGETIVTRDQHFARIPGLKVLKY